MRKTIRPTYPLEISIGLLFLVFVIALFLSAQIFSIPRHLVNEEQNEYPGMFLASFAVVIMCLVLWEEFLFPIKVKHIPGGAIFRNHRNKLKSQLLIYLAIPLIFIFIYFNYAVNPVRFGIWAAICMIIPVAGKLISGLKNYNDFLILTTDTIEYRNNHEVGKFQIKDIRQITLVRDERKVLHKIQLVTANDAQIMIDLDEMELADFFLSIDKFMTARYSGLLAVA